jgi:hypothetical protein
MIVRFSVGRGSGVYGGVLVRPESVVGEAGFVPVAVGSDVAGWVSMAVHEIPFE